MAFYDKPLIISKHAIERYIERSITKKSEQKLEPFEAELKMWKEMENALKIDISPSEFWYEIVVKKRKMIFVVKDNIVVTFKWK